MNKLEFANCVTWWDASLAISNFMFSDRIPNRSEQKILKSLTELLLDTDIQGDAIELQEIFARCNEGSIFKCRGPIWKTIGFQNENPISDVRGGGLLSLRNLEYFLAHDRRGIAMQQKRSRGREEGANYPWAAAGISLTRLIAQEFEMIHRSGKAKNLREVNPQPFFQMILEKDAFNRLYSSCFLLLDHYWDSSNASYLQFQQVLHQCALHFSILLRRSKTVSDVSNEVELILAGVDSMICKQ